MTDAALFRPVRLRSLTVPNRVWVSPMCQYSADGRDGMPTDWHLVHLGALAQGGAGLVMTEATAVSPEGRISAWDLGIWNDAQRDALARIVDFVHDRGAVAAIQLAHAGRKASTLPEWKGHGSQSLEDGGWTTVAPSSSPLLKPITRLGAWTSRSMLGSETPVPVWPLELTPQPHVLPSSSTAKEWLFPAPTTVALRARVPRTIFSGAVPLIFRRSMTRRPNWPSSPVPRV